MCADHVLCSLFASTQIWCLGFSSWSYHLPFLSFALQNCSVLSQLTDFYLTIATHPKDKRLINYTLMRLNFYENHNPKPDPPRSFNHSDLSAWSCLVTSQSVSHIHSSHPCCSSSNYVKQLLCNQFSSSSRRRSVRKITYF